MTQQMQRSFRSDSCNALSARYVGVSSLYYGYYYYYAHTGAAGHSDSSGGSLSDRGPLFDN